ncbi:aldehyde dehydrogenase family protein [Bacillus testis]|uniref:aldehyde dehydrogenase family protein n=1 Tax=Bacillus testis TaxID=1622072 RepID=UPI00067F2553|nr:aldehyde dehydrogenase family protein [Bacillus testis]
MKTENKITVYENIIGGKKIGSSTGKKLESYDPATGKVWAIVPAGSEQDALEAIKSSKEAFPAWAAIPAMERSAYLRRIADAITEYGQELAELETKDNGWVFRETTYGLIPSLESIWHEGAAACMAAGRGETVHLGKSTIGYTLREPLGVVVGIIPWNAPLFTFSIKAAAALAGGNTVIIKPSELAAVSSLRLGELINDILPPGVLNVVCGEGEALGKALVSHLDVSKVSLTGSGRTAKAIARATADSPKPMTLELGGKSPNIVFADADLQKAAYGVTLNGIFTGNAGQICVGGSRILIQRPVYEEMVALMKQQLDQHIKLGDTMNMETSMGPVANAQQFERVKSYIELGGKEEGTIIYGGRTGGERLVNEDSRMSGGYWVEPTLIEVDSNSRRVCQEEIFGPVAIVMPFDHEEEVLAIANETAYGLGAGIWTKDLERAHRMVASLESGNVWVNTYRRVGPELPFGGQKESGFGTDSFLEFTREKTCYIEIG